MELGKRNTLKINRKSDFGFFLVDNSGAEILLPNRYCRQDMSLGDPIEVFVYRDSEERLTAISDFPKAEVGQAAVMPVRMTNDHGAFVDWGLPKDLFVPYREQKQRLSVGETPVIYVYVDIQSERLVGSAHIDRFLKDDDEHFQRNDEVDILVYEKSDTGYKAIINNYYRGLLFHEDLIQKIQIGFQAKAFIKKIRDDKKIDLALSKQGYIKVLDEKERIITALQASGGFLPYHDKSDSNAIHSFFGISKATFKKSIGALYKEKRIQIEDEGIRLVQNDILS